MASPFPWCFPGLLTPCFLASSLLLTPTRRFQRLHVGVIGGGVWWGSLTVVTLRTRLATAVTWHAVGDGGDMALAAAVTWRLVSTKTPSLGPFGHL